MANHRMLAGWALSALLGAGCDMPQPPGESVGEYAITGTLVDNSCGSDAVPAANPLEFTVDLRDDDGQGYWMVQPPAIPGRLMAGGEFSFRLENTADVEDPDAVAPMFDEPEDFTDPARFDVPESRVLCRLRIAEVIEGRVLRASLDGFDLDGVEDAGVGEVEDEIDLVGENEIEIRALSGADCDRVLASGGGPFRELPCSVRYEITGELVDG